MPASWLVAATALTAGVLTGPEVGGLGRALAAAALLLALALGRRRRVVALGIAVGLWGGWRQGEPLRAVRAWTGERVIANLEVIDGNGPTRSATAWLGAPGRPSIRVRVSSKEPLHRGERGTATVQVERLPRRRNPDDANRRRSALARRVAGRAQLEQWVPTSSTRASFRPQMRSDLADRLDDLLQGSAGLWRALWLGDRGALPDEARDRFAWLGLAHLLALSGLHVGLVWWGLRWTCRRLRLPDGWLWVPVAMWCLLAGLTPSLARAIGMALWWGLSRRVERPARVEDSLAWLAILEWTIAPWRLCSVGWWLSYAATLAILRLVPHLVHVPKLIAGGLVSLAAQTATLPWVLAVFGYVAPWASVVQLVVAPVFTGLMIGSLFLLPLSAAPGVGARATALLQLATHGFGELLRRIDSLDLPVWGHPGLSGAAWAGAWGIIALVALPGPRVRLRIAVAVLTLVGVHAPLVRFEPSWVSLDVGQGDAGVLRSRRNEWLVVDTGPRWPSWDAGESVVLPYLRRRNASGVDVVLSHGHLDHYGGTEALLNSGRVRRVIFAQADRSETWAQRLAELTQVAGAQVEWVAAGDWVGPAKCLWPPPQAPGYSTNDRSVVLSVPTLSLLLTGDLEQAGEAQIRSTLGPHHVLKLGHHGSRTSSGPAWLDVVRPDWAIASCGRRNRYGHPHPSTLATLGAYDVGLRRTDASGAIRVSWRNSGAFVIAVSDVP